MLRDFEDLAGLPYCASAMDGTLMPIRKPTVYGDCHGAIRILPQSWCWFLLMPEVYYVKSGTPGSAGDSATFTSSRLARKMEADKISGCCCHQKK